MKVNRSEFVVIGAGVFGVWIAHFLRRRGHTVTLVDAFGAGNNRSSSGDESRVIRMGYGGDTLYTQWAARSLRIWQEVFHDSGQPLFIKTGVLWLGTDADLYTTRLSESLSAERIAHEKLSAQELASRFPQFGLDGISVGVLEPDSGVLLARRSVMAVLDDAIRSGVQYSIDAIASPEHKGIHHLDHLQTRAGRDIGGEVFIFACGAWLPKISPDLLGKRIFPTRQEVFFFGPPSGTQQFRPPSMPVWLHHQDEVYGLPDIENRGIKIASDRHGEQFDPETGDRVVSAQGLREMREYLQSRLPALKDSPLVETRVCQYENTSNGDFLLDRHPEIDNVWLAGGGSGHGFKHGPMVGQYMAGRILDDAEPEPRFSIERKLQVQQRSVY
jgi:monomeric sarcosine oxidase